jgi:hypothetical protein
MREYGAIHTRYWSWAQEVGLSESSKLLGAYLLTSQHSNSLGCYRIPKGYVSEDLGYSIDRVSKGFLELGKHSFLAYCEDTKYLLLIKYLKWNPIQNAKHGKGVSKIATNIPRNCKIIELLIKSLKDFGGKYLEKNLTDTLYHTLSKENDIDYRYTDQDTDQDTDIDNTIYCPEQSSEQDVPKPDSLIILLPTNKKNVSHPVYQSYIDEMQELYPAVNVLQSLKTMKAWLINNPKRRKSNVPRFINSWLSKDQDKGGPVGTPQGPQPTTFAQKQAQDKDSVAKLLLLSKGRRPSGEDDPRHDVGDNSGAIALLPECKHQP